MYIGSTFESLKKRLGNHKSKCKRLERTVKSIVKFDDCVINSIAEYENISLQDLRKKEQEAIDANKDKCVNAISAYSGKEGTKAKMAKRFVCETCGVIGCVSSYAWQTK